MKRQQTSYHDLHRIFDQGITVRDIAEPLASFDANCPAEEARKFMVDRDYDVIGVRADGEIQGYALAEDLTGGSVGDHLHEFIESEVLEQNDSLLVALAALRDRSFACVRFLGEPSGIVTRGDLQKTPMRMWLFGLLSILEMQMLRWIRDTYPDSSWESHLSPERLEMARDLLLVRKERNEAIDLADCLELSDKGKVFQRSDLLLSLTGSGSPRIWKSYMGKVVELRNTVAHGNDIPPDDWPGIAETIDATEKILKHLENGI